MNHCWSELPEKLNSGNQLKCVSLPPPTPQKWCQNFWLFLSLELWQARFSPVFGAYSLEFFPGCITECFGERAHNLCGSWTYRHPAGTWGTVPGAGTKGRSDQSLAVTGAATESRGQEGQPSSPATVWFVLYSDSSWVAPEDSNKHCLLLARFLFKGEQWKQRYSLALTVC